MIKRFKVKDTSEVVCPLARPPARWKKKGFTLIETLLVVGILAVLLVLGSVVFGDFTRRDQILLEARKIEAVINEAKAKTLAGFSQGGSESLNFGVYFASDRYVLFPGLTFDPGNADNQEFLLAESLEITPIFLPSGRLVFEKINGEVRDFDPVQNYLVVNDKNSGLKKKVSVNQLGVVKIEEF